MKDIFKDYKRDNLNAKSKQIENTKLKELATKTFESRTFEDKHRVPLRLNMLLKGIANLLSFCTASLALTLILKIAFWGVFSAYTTICIVVCISIVLGLILEVFKKNAVEQSIKSIVLGQFSFAFFAALLLIALSLSLSFYGAKHIPSMTSKEPQQTNIDSLKKANEAEVTEAIKAKDEYFESNKKPNNLGGYRLSSRYMNTYNQMIKGIEEMKKANEAEVMAATKANEAEVMNHENKNANDGVKLGYIAIAFEILFIFCTFYYFYALKMIRIETYVSSDTETPRNDKRPNTAPVKAKKATLNQLDVNELNKKVNLSENRSKIGFQSNSIVSCKNPKCSNTFDKNKYPKNKKFCSTKCRVAYHKQEKTV